MVDMITSINTVHNELLYECDLYKEIVDYDRLYNQKHIIERKVDDSDDDDNKSICELESVDEHDLYHYHFGDYYESMSNEEMTDRNQNRVVLRNDTNQKSNKRVYKSDENDNNDFNLGISSPLLLRTISDTNEKCFDTIEYDQDTFLSYSLAIHVVTTKSSFPSMLSIHSWIQSQK